MTRLGNVRFKPAAHARDNAAPAAPAAAPPMPTHPSRIWVQLGVGHDRAALGSDWRRLVHTAADVLKGHQPFLSDAGGRSRMLTGPFASEAAARDFVRQLDEAGVAGPYVWTSPAGQVVDSLDAR